MGRCSQIARERKKREERREKREERESLRRRKIREGKIQDSRESNSNGAKSSEPSSSSLPTCKVTVVRFYKGSPPSSSSAASSPTLGSKLVADSPTPRAQILWSHLMSGKQVCDLTVVRHIPNTFCR